MKQMTKEEIAKRLASLNRCWVSRETSLSVMWLYSLENGLIGEPGSSKIDRLRHFLATADLGKAPRRRQRLSAVAREQSRDVGP
jgi:hypothetical protein